MYKIRLSDHDEAEHSTVEVKAEPRQGDLVRHDGAEYRVGAERVFEKGEVYYFAFTTGSVYDKRGILSA